jgi:Protein of unknown function (DUF3103)
VVADEQIFVHLLFERRSMRLSSTRATALSMAALATAAFGLASCQHGGDSVLPATADGVAGGSAKGVGGTTTASAEDMRKVLSPEERKQKIAEFLAKPEVKQTSQGLEELAKLVAVAVDDESLRNQVFARCMEKFDGETNVLWKQLDSDNKLRATAGGGFSERVEAVSSKSREAQSGVVRSLGGVKAAVAKFEKNINGSLHLLWAFPSNWDKKTTPLVAFVPLDASVKTRKSIPAFDAQGNSFIVDEATARQRPVLVVTVNERTDVTGKVREGMMSQRTANSPQNVEKKSKGGGAIAAINSRRVVLDYVTFYWTGDEWFEGSQEFYARWWIASPIGGWYTWQNVYFGVQPFIRSKRLFENSKVH